jgi:hypothetical protein
MIDDPLRYFDSICLNNLRINLDYGWAYQKDIKPFQYGKSYWDNYVSLEDTELGEKLTQFRCNLVLKYCNNILDVGIGSGSFLKYLKINKKGFDVNPHGIDWLIENKLFLNPYKDNLKFINGFCFWDVIEHFENPNTILSLLPKKSFAFISIPIFNQIEWIQKSKHYKPNEHLCYFTTKGFIEFMKYIDFTLIEMSSQETILGRDSIMTFVFQKRGDANG